MIYAKKDAGMYRVVHMNEDGYWYGKTLSRLPADSVPYAPLINRLACCYGCKDTFTIPCFGPVWKQNARGVCPPSPHSPDVTSAYDAAIILFAKAFTYNANLADGANTLMYNAALVAFEKNSTMVTQFRDKWMYSGPECNDIHQVILENWNWASSMSKWAAVYEMVCHACKQQSTCIETYAGTHDGQLPIAVMGKVVGHPHLWGPVLLSCSCGAINTCSPKSVYPPRIIFAQTGLVPTIDSLEAGYVLDNISTYTALSVEYTVFGTVYMELCTGHYLAKVCIECGDRTGRDCWAFVDDRMAMKTKKFCASGCRYTSINANGIAHIPVLFGLVLKSWDGT